MKSSFLFTLLLVFTTATYAQNEPGFIMPGSHPGSFTAVGNTLFFTAWDSQNGMELWKTDGTEQGTVLVKDVRPGRLSSHPRDLVAMGNALYFPAFTEETGIELWRSDGTEEGTTLVKDIYPGDVYDEYGNRVKLRAPKVIGGNLYFAAEDGAHCMEPWQSDGTAEGTFMIKDINKGKACSHPTNFTGYNGKIYFVAYDPATGRELWTSDGTEKALN